MTTTNTGMEEEPNADGRPWPKRNLRRRDTTLSNGATIEAVARHRNGVSGAPFRVAIINDLFGTSCDELAGRRFLVVTFDAGAGFTAVLDIDDLAFGLVDFGENSWRGDVAADICRDTILSLV